MRKTLLLCMVAVFLSGCTSLASLQATPTQTLTPIPTLTPTLAPTETPKIPTMTPVLMDIHRVEGAFKDGIFRFNKDYKEAIHLISVGYEGGTADSPTILKFEIQDDSDVSHDGCLFPIAIVSYSILPKYKYVFPQSLENFKVVCSTPAGQLLFSYMVSFEDALGFASAGQIDLERLAVIEIYLPTFTPEASSTPRPTFTATRRPTLVPAVSTQGPPQGVTAICKDGSYSYSKHQSGTCSRSGGVQKWINKPPN